MSANVVAAALLATLGGGPAAFAAPERTGSASATVIRSRSSATSTVFGETTIRNLLRMASGARYKQGYNKGEGDTDAFWQAAYREAGDTSLGREREAFWRGVLRHYD